MLLKGRTEPWMNTEIVDNIRHWDNLLYRFKKNTADAELYRSFCKIRNRVHRDIKADYMYFSNKIYENKKQPKKIW